MSLMPGSPEDPVQCYIRCQEHSVSHFITYACQGRHITTVQQAFPVPQGLAIRPLKVVVHRYEYAKEWAGTAKCRHMYPLSIVSVHKSENVLGSNGYIRFKVVAITPCCAKFQGAIGNGYMLIVFRDPGTWNYNSIV